MSESTKQVAVRHVVEQGVRPKEGRFSSWQEALPIVLLLVLLALIWEFGPPLLGMPHYILPRLSGVLQSGVDNSALLAKHFAVTLGEALLGLAMSIAAGVLTAIWIAASKIASRTLYPLIIASQTIPIIALSPILVMWFGYEIWSKVAVVMLFTFFPIAVNTVAGLRSADPQIGELLQSMGASRLELFLRWQAPSALPGFFTGLKMAATISVGGAALGEWLGGEAGLGMYTRRASNMLRGEAVFSGVLLLTFMGVLLFLVVLLLERLLLSKGMRKQS